MDNRITALGFKHEGQNEHDHYYSRAIDLPPALAAERAKNNAGPLLVYVRVYCFEWYGDSITVQCYGVDDIGGGIDYDTSKGVYAALCYANAVISARNAAWIANYKPFTQADWDEGESRIIA